MTDLLTPVIIGLHLATAHVGAPAGTDLNSATPGVYLRTAAGLTLGAFRNSHERGSAYAAWTWTTADGRWSITAGGVTGYPSAKLSPLLAPSLRIGLGALAPNWAARITLLPKARTDGAYGIHLSTERAL